MSREGRYVKGRGIYGVRTRFAGDDGTTPPNKENTVDKEGLTELLPCPFCGCSAWPSLEDDEWVSCSSPTCDAMQSGSVGAVKMTAAEAWNRRVETKK